MIDTEHDSINWGLIIVLLANMFYWYSVYWYGFFVPTMWTIVIAAMIGLGFKVWEMRV